MGLEVPLSSDANDFQAEGSVDSFGFEWTWDAEARTEVDLSWRVASRYNLDRSFYGGKLVLDAGAGAGDQSRWLLESKPRGLVSVELSKSIDVVRHKLAHLPNWVGIRGDLTRLPLADETFDFVYCEGVIQHTRDSQIAVHELCRVLRTGGSISATHYGYQSPAGSGLKPIVRRAINRIFFHRRWERLSKWDRDKLFLYCGVIAWLAHRPIIGPFLRRFGYAVYNPRMLTFKTTWSCTYDAVGTHTYSREISQHEFRRCFETVPASRMKFLFIEGNVFLAEKQAALTPFTETNQGA
jgi:SAM-dependent methyltransferase